MGCQTIGVSDYWGVRPMGCQTIGVSDQWGVGLMGCPRMCSLLLQNCLTDFSNADANLPREQCRFATYTSFWHSPLHDCRSRSQDTSNFVNLDVWRVVVCVCFSSETTQPISPMLIPIYRGNNVDLQHILHFDLHPSMTAIHVYRGWPT